MAGHTPWNQIKHKKQKPRAMNIIVYDMGNNPLDPELMKEVEQAVEKIVRRQSETIAHTVVTDQVR